MMNLRVEEFYIEQKEKLSLELVSGQNGLQRKITVSDINRPGLALAGYFDYFAYERIQVLGRTELSFLQGLGREKVGEIFRKLLEWDVCCFVITQGLEPPEDNWREMVRERLEKVAWERAIEDARPFLEESVDVGV